jgi:hypothetical protein
MLIFKALLVLAISAAVSVGQRSASAAAATQPADQPPPQPQLIIKTPPISSAIRLNPGKGWVLYGDISAYSPELLALGSVNYERTEWSTLEPRQGVFDWKFIGDRIRRCAALGKSFAFGVMCANVNSTQEYPTPKWVFDLGASSYTSKSTVTGVTQIIPVWDDPIFLRELANFAQALGKRYDANPHIAFIDIRSYGNWGEGHLWGIGGTRIPAAALKRHILNYQRAFPHTRLVLPWGEKAYDPVYLWAINRGIGLRRDGICGNSDGSETLPCFGKVPAVFEFFDTYENMKNLGWWDGRQTADGDGHTLMECFKNGRPSYIGLSVSPKSAAVFVREQRPLIAELANSMGYDLAIRRAAFPNIWHPGAAAHLELTVENIGVAPIYGPTTLAVALLDDTGRAVERFAVQPADVNPRNWQPGKPAVEKVNVTFTAIGSYRLALGLFTDPQQKSPDCTFASEGSTADRWLVLDRVWLVKP